MDFWRAVGILNHRKWLIILSVIVATGLTYAATRLTGAKWVAQVRLMAVGNSPLTSLQTKGGGEADAFVPEKGSQRDIDRKQMAAIEVVMKSPNVAYGARDILKARSAGDLPKGVLDRIEIKQDGPGVYVMQYSDTSPDRATKVANAFAEAFINRFKEMRTEQAQNTVDLLQGQVTLAEANLAAVRQRYDRFRDERSLIGQPATEVEAVAQRVLTANQRLDDVKQRYADAQAQLSAKRRELATLSPTIKVPGKPIQNQMIPELRKEQNTAQKEYSRLSARYTAEHPLVKKAKSDLEEVNRQLDKEMKSPMVGPATVEPNPDYTLVTREVNRLKAEAAGLSASLGAMSSALGAAQGEMNRYKGVDTRIATLASELQQATDARNSTVTRRDLAQIKLDEAKSAQQPITIAALVSDDVNPPMNASEGRTQKLLVLAFLGALLGTSAVVVALDSVDRRLKTVGQAELALPARVIAAIPQPTGAVSYSGLARATELQPSSLHSEAYRFLGLHLLSPRGPRIRSLMVLSAKAEQGSTTTVTNLAITLAQAGKKVILVDANVRTAELHQVFETPNELGFTDLLQNPSNSLLEQALQPTSVANLQIITSGPMTNNAWQLFRSENLIEVSRKLHERADFVLYDTPSALIFTDALNLAPVVDAAFLCVRALEPLTGAEQRVVELLEQNNVSVLGSVLNDVPTAVVEGYHNYQHYYGGPGAGTPAIAARTGSLQPMIEMPGTDRPGRKNGAS
jgi:capsular exopolysaccharide synthesis family protein